MGGQVETHPSGLLDRCAQRWSAAEVERAERAHVHRQLGDELLDDRGRKRAAKAVAGADDDELEQSCVVLGSRRGRVDPRLQLVELIGDAEQRLLELPRGRASAHR